ncbi:ABC transporter substrate-binding protein [Nocardioides abyssi]|uniref:ABC transporter substrate-binding protein n=1 Tax=Nocardioides abyssi TaxID=3058370 RepID=A0ABT8ETK4_9ACTN|nr:ABC transporter substrate-binding protein [Nocardioides abyssi]MDN4161476.1 ABC transporter substrate-binding protein [Nocardioides abyssi]
MAEPPTDVVTLNQGATEVVLALGLADQLAGTAYLDDAVPGKWRAAYDAVPVLSAEYPTNEQLLAARPDFVYASYASAFEPAVAGTQEDLAAAGVGAYLSPFGCPEAEDRPGASFEAVWDEVADVATALGHPEAAERLRDQQGEQLADLRSAAAGEGLDVLWWDGGTKSPNVGAGDGGPQLVLDAVGATNVFADLPGSWAEGSWEDVLSADPDVIVLVDAAWDPAADKRAYLESDPVLQGLTAVREQRYAVVPFSASTAGVRLVDGAAALAAQLDELGLDG